MVHKYSDLTIVHDNLLIRLRTLRLAVEGRGYQEPKIKEMVTLNEFCNFMLGINSSYSVEYKHKSRHNISDDINTHRLG